MTRPATHPVRTLAAVLVILILSVFLVLAGLFLTGHAFNAGPVEIVSRFYAFARAEQVEQSYAYTTAQFREFASQDDLALFIAQQPAFIDTALKEAVLLRRVNDEAVVHAIAARGEEEFPLLITLKKVEKNWKIENISVDPADMPAVAETTNQD